jgi:hypothetical protein
MAWNSTYIEDPRERSLDEFIEDQFEHRGSVNMGGREPISSRSVCSADLPRALDSLADTPTPLAGDRLSQLEWAGPALGRSRSSRRSHEPP